MSTLTPSNNKNHTTSQSSYFSIISAGVKNAISKVLPGVITAEQTSALGQEIAKSLGKDIVPSTMTRIRYINIYYIPRNIFLTSSAVEISKTVTFNDSIMDNFYEIKDTFDSNEELRYPSKFKYSFYDLLDIPPYSYVPIYTDIRYVLRNEDLLSKLLKYFILHFNYFKEPDCTYYVRPNDIQLYFEYRVKTKPYFIGDDVNKIHLFVKHEYILYAALKVASLHRHFMENCFFFKFNLFNAASNLRPEDTELYRLKMNGGIAPTIIIYGSSDPAIMSKLLQLVLDLFPDHEELGLMDTTGIFKLSPFNIRLNTLVSYAAGDRGKSLNFMLANIGKKGTNVVRTPPYTIPKWFDDMTRDCTPATREDLNRRSQLFLGIDACNSDGSRIDYYEKCKGTITEDKKYCYITRTGDTLDPRRFVGGRRSRAHPKKGRSKRRTHPTKKRR